MKVGVLGTGMVGKTIATKLVELGHEVCMGSREAGHAGAGEWAAEAGERASRGRFSDAAEFGELVFNCTAGAGAVAAVEAAGAGNLVGKLLIDVTNPLDFSGEAPRLFAVNDDSLGERVQAAVPEARVVKALNTINCELMVDPGLVPDDHVVFVCGNDEQAKQQVTVLLGEFDWPAERVLDLGDITAARGTEAYLLLWLRLMGAVGGSRFNIALRADPGTR